MIYLRNLNEEEVLHFSLESVESAEDWILSILRAMKGKSLREPVTPQLWTIDDSISCLLSEFDACAAASSYPPPKATSLVVDSEVFDIR